MNAEQIKERGRGIAIAARSCPRWQDLNRQMLAAFEAGQLEEAEECLQMMADVLEESVEALLNQVPDAYRDQVAVAVTVYFARLTGVMN